MTRIIHLITGLATGGAERALFNLLHGGLTENINSQVISLGDGGTIGPLIRELGVPVNTLDMRGGRPSIPGLAKLYRIIRRFQPDLIQGWMYHGNLAATLARSMLSERAALVWNIRQSLYQIANEKLLTRQIIRVNRAFSGSPDVLLYNSQNSRKQHETFGFVANNGQVIPNGVDLRRFRFSEDAQQRVRSELAIPTEAIIIGHVARLHPIKDHANFLLAAEPIALRYPNVHFLLSGLDVYLDNDNLRQNIPTLLQNRFHLLGERSDVPNLMSAMDIFCLSSAGEGFPNVIVEAMATGLPCVVTDVGDSAIIIGDTGVVVPFKDSKALTTGIERLLTMPLEKRRALGAAARTRIETNYTLETIVKQYVTLYEHLMQEIS